MSKNLFPDWLLPVATNQMPMGASMNLLLTTELPDVFTYTLDSLLFMTVFKLTVLPVPGLERSVSISIPSYTRVFDITLLVMLPPSTEKYTTAPCVLLTLLL